MTGNDNTLILQRSRQDNALIDRVARTVLNRTGNEFREGEFAQVVANDERVINGPGVNVPCISISRWPYDEYHTSDDNPSIMHEDKLQEAADISRTDHSDVCIQLHSQTQVPRTGIPIGLWFMGGLAKELGFESCDREDHDAFRRDRFGL